VDTLCEADRILVIVPSDLIFPAEIIP
jgi:hypothetical protein